MNRAVPARSRVLGAFRGNNVAQLVCGALMALGVLIATSDAHASPAGYDPTEHYNWTDLDYSSKNIVGEPLEKGEPRMSPPMILMLMNFAIVLFIIGWKVRPPVAKFMEKRHQSIKEALDEATRLREEAQQKLDEYDQKLVAAEKEVEQIISDIRTSARAEKDRIMADAEAQAAAMKRDAEARIAAEITNARAELERAVINAAITAAETLLRGQATQRDHTSLIETFITDVDKQPSIQEQA